MLQRTAIVLFGVLLASCSDEPAPTPTPTPTPAAAAEPDPVDLGKVAEHFEAGLGQDPFFDAEADQANLVRWRRRIIDREENVDPELELRALYMLTLNVLDALGRAGRPDTRRALRESVDRYVSRARIELREWRERDATLSGFDGDRYEANLTFLGALAWLMQRGHPDSVCRKALLHCTEQGGDYQTAAQAVLDEIPKEDHYGDALKAVSDGNFDEALAAFGRHLNRFARDEDALCQRGLVRLRTGAQNEALADFDRCLEINPENAAALEGRGHALFRLGKTSEAVEAWEEAARHSARRAPTLHLYVQAAKESR